jgi:protein involved in polysaccharide export with SLBB domain
MIGQAPAAAPASAAGAMTSSGLPTVDAATGLPSSASTVTNISQQPSQDQTSQRSQDQRTTLTSAPASPAPLTEYQQVILASNGRLLPIFGASIFSYTPSTFAPVDNIPVTPDYLIGPGDELRLQIWGQVNQRGDFVVDRTGSISLPEIGTIHVAGLQFSQITDFLRSQIARVYRNFDLNVNLGQLRSIQVFVVGQAKKPGSFTIGSLSTLLNALFASGGPLPQGSLRDIQVERGSQTITHFDLYDLLLHGDKSKDVRLEPGDVIFIPDVGPQVAVMGSVTNPAIYELRGEKSFNQVIALAGGLTNVASNSQVRVERVYRHAEHSVIDVDLAAANAPPVQDGDMVTVTPILERFQNAVTLRGNVANPGRYPFHEGMRISDLIPSREALVTRNYYQRQNQLGQANRDYSPEYSASSGSLGLRAGPAADAAANRETVGSSGGGNSIGAALTSGSNVFGPTTDVILTAPDIDWEYAVVERQNADNLTTTLLPFNLGKAVIDKDPSQDLPLLPRDIVTIFSKADIRVPSDQQTKFIRLEGEFVAAGVYSVAPGETLRQLIDRAGGLTPQADLFASEFTRDTVRRLQRQHILEYADELESQVTATSSASGSSALTDRDAAAAAQSATAGRAVIARLRQAQPTGRIVLPLKPDSTGVVSLPDFELQDGDRFVVPRAPTTVSVEGQVYNANAFLYLKGKRVKDYLRLAGGPDRIADRKREFILRADGSVVSHQYGNLAEHAIFADRNFGDVVLYPGDTIIVPPIIEKTAILRNLSDIGTILEGFGLGAAAIEVLK